jgi:hypothetical protein
LAAASEMKPLTAISMKTIMRMERLKKLMA